MILKNLSLTASSRVAGALVAQSTYWKLRDRGTYSLEAHRPINNGVLIPLYFIKLMSH